MTLLNQRAAIHVATSTLAPYGSHYRNDELSKGNPLGRAFARKAQPRLDRWPAGTSHPIHLLGRLYRHNHLHGLVEAANAASSNLRTAKAQTTFVRDGQQRDEPQSQIAEYRLDDDTAITGWIDPADGTIAAADTRLIATETSRLGTPVRTSASCVEMP